MDALPAGFEGLACWSPEQLSGPTLELAPALLGSFLVRHDEGAWLVGRIVETEAYLAAGDLACHAHRGETPRNRPMFGEAGHAYVYRIYGLHMCMNVVTEPPGQGAAVLIRALEPVWGESRMAQRRGRADLTNGPGKLCQALAIDLALNGADLSRPGSLFLLKGEALADAAIGRTPRVGISEATEYPWRFLERGNRWVSRGPSPTSI